jgi:DNA-binding LytR/AlgR family response regulator
MISHLHQSTFPLFLIASLIYKTFTKHFLMIYASRQINLDLLTPTTLTSFAQTLAKDQFVGIHKSIIVQLSFIGFIKENGLTDH